MSEMPKHVRIFHAARKVDTRIDALTRALLANEELQALAKTADAQRQLRFMHVVMTDCVEAARREHSRTWRDYYDAREAAGLPRVPKRQQDDGAQQAPPQAAVGF